MSSYGHRNFEGANWGRDRYITPELLRHYGIGTGYFQNKPGQRGALGGYGSYHDGRSNANPMTDYYLEGYAPWNEWGGQARYDDYRSRYNELAAEINKIPQVGSEEDLARLTALSSELSGYRESAGKLHDEGKAIQDDYISKWLEAYGISYDPDKDVGSGRYTWNTGTRKGQIMSKRSERRRTGEPRPLGDDHWYEEPNPNVRSDRRYKIIQQGYHKWDNHAKGALQRFKIRPPEPPKKLPDTNTVTTAQGTTTVDPMPEADWYSGSPRGAKGVKTQRGLSISKRGSKYGKSFRRSDLDITNKSLNI
tara:strand:- start:59 stop:979 length:921 start_codon:yes stop_codon:yes gene_type:complete